MKNPPPGPTKGEGELGEGGGSVKTLITIVEPRCRSCKIDKFLNWELDFEINLVR